MDEGRDALPLLPPEEPRGLARDGALSGFFSGRRASLAADRPAGAGLSACFRVCVWRGWAANRGTIGRGPHISGGARTRCGSSGEVHIIKPRATTRYRQLLGFMEFTPGTPRMNRAVRNVAVMCGDFICGNYVRIVDVGPHL